LSTIVQGNDVLGGNPDASNPIDSPPNAPSPNVVVTVMVGVVDAAEAGDAATTSGLRTAKRPTAANKTITILPVLT